MFHVLFLGYTTLAILLDATATRAAVGPIGNLHLTNVNMAPDGFNRSVVAAGGAVPGPLIKGNKVSEPSRYLGADNNSK